ncbi:MAG: hypothetical protein JST00_40740 [Deltaproteobacteria bacterium]|nr:hypothetical protein [Deltaproteobacteria bacterium]
MKGRATELATLAHTIEATAPTRLALVGSGGTGKSMLAAALGHHLAARFGGRIHWFRVASWDFRTLAEMLALRFGTTRERGKIVPALRRHLSREERLVVLDNHEDDAAMARLLTELAGTKATFVITARRCLLGGVLLFPLTAPLAISERSAFPRVAALTRMLRMSPLALDIADAIVGSGDETVRGLAEHLEREGIATVRVIDHEDDLPEVALLIAWAWPRLSAEAKRMLGVLAHVEGDHVDVASLAALAKVSRAKIDGALASLSRWHLVQEAMPSRFTVHAVVRHAVQKRTTSAPAEVFEHYVSLLEKNPGRLLTEQTHLFAAMDHAHRTSDLDGMLRVERLLAKLEEGSGAARGPTG